MGLSVSRVGSAAQIKAMKQVAGKIKGELAQFREMAAFAQFGSDLDEKTKALLERGRRIVELFKQQQYQPLPVEMQAAVLYAMQQGYMDKIDVEKIKDFQAKLQEFLETRKSALLDKIREKKAIDEALGADLKAALDEFAPAYQFGERHAIPIRASAWQVFDAVLTVSASEIPFYRELAWVRRGGHSGPETILNPPDDVPLIAVATRTSFVELASRPGREFVMGTVVIAPPGVRLALGSNPESFKTLTQPGFAKATIGFEIQPQPDGSCRLLAETRVHATDYVSRATFARYWRVIGAGSGFVRQMWLRAIKIRAESSASAPPPPARPKLPGYLPEEHAPRSALLD